MLLALTASMVAWVGAAAAQDARLDYERPVVGETLQVLVDRVPPGARVGLTLRSDESLEGRTLPDLLQIADASGCARFEFLVPAELAGQGFWLSATLGGGLNRRTPETHVRFQQPQILVTGVSAGRAVASRIYVTGSEQNPFVLAESWTFEPGRPGGAVRDGRGTRTFVVTDAEVGRIEVLRDLELGGGVIASLPLPGDIRGIAATPDGRFVLVTSAGDGRNSVLSILDTREDRPGRILHSQLLLDPLGPSGGKLVVAPGGLRAFVSVQGVFLREIDLFIRQPGALVTVGGAAQDEVRDLRIADGFLYALTGRSDQVTYLTGLEVGNLNHLHQEGPDLNVTSIGVGRSRGGGALLLLNGEGGQLTVIDTETMQRTGDPITIQPGALALLLSPDPSRDTGGLLYPSGVQGSEVRPIGFERFEVGEPIQFPFQARPLPVHGQSARIDWFFLADDRGRAFVLEPDTLRSIDLELPFDARAVSVSR